MWLPCEHVEPAWRENVQLLKKHLAASHLFRWYPGRLSSNFEISFKFAALVLQRVGSHAGVEQGVYFSTSLGVNK